MDPDDQLTAGCPKCGAPLAGGEAECPACGVIIAKARSRPAPPASRPAPAARSQPPAVSPATLSYLQGTAGWVHTVAFVTLLAGGLFIIGSLFLLFRSAAELDQASEAALLGLAISGASLPMAVATLLIGVRLMRFAGALSPRGRQLRHADLQTLADLHTGLWWWVIGIAVVYLACGLALGLLTPPTGW